MKHFNTSLWAGTVLLAAAIAGCGSSTTVNNEASTSAIRAAEEVGASSVPSASLYLQFAKEELENARVLAAKGDNSPSKAIRTRKVLPATTRSCRSGVRMQCARISSHVATRAI